MLKDLENIIINLEVKRVQEEVLYFNSPEEIDNFLNNKNLLQVMKNMYGKDVISILDIYTEIDILDNIFEVYVSLHLESDIVTIEPTEHFLQNIEENLEEETSLGCNAVFTEIKSIATIDAIEITDKQLQILSKYSNDLYELGLEYNSTL